MAMYEYISHHKENIKEAEINNKLDDKIKKELINFSKNILKFSEKHLNKINSKIK